MLAISKKSRYGLKALLALTESYGHGLLQTRDIAARQAIPRQYLEQIFNLLGKANIIRSVRGKQGGYELARSPAEIMAAEVITLLEGGVELVPPAENGGDVIHEILRSAEEGLLNALDVSLAELVSMQQARRNIIMYDI